MAALTGSRSPALTILAVLAALLLWPGDAAAEAVLKLPMCHAVAERVQPPGTSPPPFTCDGKDPAGYQEGSLWLRADIGHLPVDPENFALLLHYSRFDRLEVIFTYSDHRTFRQAVRSGDFGTHWHPGGQIAFAAPFRDVPLQYVTMRFDRLASVEMLRMRVMTQGEADVQAMALSICIGAALTLLLIGTIYNASLAFSLQREFPVWQALWSGSMFAWGVIWSQLHLLVFPHLAGTVSAQLCSALACLAVTSAAFSAISALEVGTVPRAMRLPTLGLAAGVCILGLPVAFIRSGPVDLVVGLVGVLLIATLLSVAISLGWGWRRGSVEARNFAGAWALPILVLSTVDFLNTETFFWGGGTQLLVLFAAAWQTLWLAAAASRTHARLRIEHDRARSAEAQAYELARRDPLTGLRNRRGFVEAVEPMLERTRAGKGPAGLLLIDVDLFKRINDTFGHDAGDMVLVTIARRIERWESPNCKVARLGGEEFALMVSGLGKEALAAFADSVRQGIGACEHDEAIGSNKVTVSIGVAESGRETDFRALYRQADEALYAAKRQGRDCVVTGQHAPQAPAAAGSGRLETAQ